MYLSVVNGQVDRFFKILSNFYHRLLLWQGGKGIDPAKFVHFGFCVKDALSPVANTGRSSRCLYHNKTFWLLKTEGMMFITK